MMLLGVESRNHWSKTVKALGLEDSLPLDWAVASKSLDWQRATVIADERFATKSYAEWHELFEAADVWHTPVNRYEDVMADEHVIAAGALAEVPGLQHELVKSPIGLSSQAGRDGPAGRAPGFGEHTAEVLDGLGYGDAAVARLLRDGVVR